MVSDINIKKAKIIHRRFKWVNLRRQPRRSIYFSRLSRLIVVSNLIGLFILVAGSLVMNEFARSYLDAKMENLAAQAELITSILGDEATGYSAAATLDVEQAREIIGRIELPDGWRIRVHDINSRLVADSAEYDDDIQVSELAPIGESKTAPEKTTEETPSFIKNIDNWIENLPWQKLRRDANRRDLSSEVSAAISGQKVRVTAFSQDDVLMAAVSVPVRRVQKILGSLTIETDEVAQVISKERQALLPFIGLAVVAAILSSMVMTLFIVKPIRQLARAAERVTGSSEKRNTIPDLSDRKDEIGDLSLVMGKMTRGLYDRVDDIADFAADVAHEIKNPLTSIRSASDTLRVAKTDQQRAKLIDIIQNDVQRMNRLISDISQASRVDAALAKEAVQILDLNLVISEICELYAPILAEEAIGIEKSIMAEPTYIRAYETSFAQVLRNLIDNAMTFSVEKGTVFLKLIVDNDRVKICVEDEGPGIPPDNLETVFERFYTERPKGAVFGSHSGLGLAICRQIVDAHNGTIWAENREEGGARFVVELPLQQVEETSSGRSRRQTKAENPPREKNNISKAS